MLCKFARELVSSPAKASHDVGETLICSSTPGFKIHRFRRVLYHSAINARCTRCSNSASEQPSALSEVGPPAVGDLQIIRCVDRIPSLTVLLRACPTIALILHQQDIGDKYVPCSSERSLGGRLATVVGSSCAKGSGRSRATMGVSTLPPSTVLLDADTDIVSS